MAAARTVAAFSLFFLGTAAGFSVLSASHRSLRRPHLELDTQPLRRLGHISMKKGRPKKNKQSKGAPAAAPTAPPASPAIPSEPLMATPPQEPLMATPPAAAAYVPPPPADAYTPPPADAAPLGGDGGFREPLPSTSAGELPDLDPLEIPDEPKLRLPSFSDYARGPGKPLPPPDSGYASKLPSINQGRPAFEVEEKEQKPTLERVVFGLSTGGIAFLIFVEIFINSPVFPTVRPFILNLIGAGDAGE